MIPSVMASWLRETNLPRKDFGASSALYIGTTMLNTLGNELMVNNVTNNILDNLPHPCSSNYPTKNYHPDGYKGKFKYNARACVTSCDGWLLLTRQNRQKSGIQHLL